MKAGRIFLWNDFAIEETALALTAAEILFLDCPEAQRRGNLNKRLQRMAGNSFPKNRDMLLKIDTKHVIP
ncbi:MAG TPA: hypothetical protein VK528_10595 [Flavobacterium sp.]|nr:hypothetical protein [Flavobacterium sp.]